MGIKGLTHLIKQKSPTSIKHVGLYEFKDKKVAIWGLAFNPKTDDMRGAPSLIIIKKLLDSGAEVECYDPVVSKDREKFEIQKEKKYNPKSLENLNNLEEIDFAKV